MSSKPSTTLRRFWLVLLAAGLLVGACSSSDDGTAEEPTASATASESATAEATESATAEATDPTPAPTDEPTTSPEFANPALEAVGAEFVAWAEFNDVPGAVLAVSFGDVTGELAYGVTDLLERDPMSTESNFRIGSVTKIVTSAVVLLLVEDGLVDLDEPVSTYLPGWADQAEAAGGADVTIRQLLQHTSGFADYAVDPAFYLEALPRLDVAIEPEEIVQFSLDQGLLFEPGTDYNYSTTNYLIAGLIIEAITGNPADLEFRSRVYEPLGLEHLFLTPGEFPPEPIVNGYFDLRNNDPGSELEGLAGLLRTFSALLPAGAAVELEDGLVIDIGALPQEFLSSVAWTGGGIEGRAADTVRLLPGYFNSGLLSEESLTELTTPSEHHNRSVGLTIEEYPDYTIYTHGGSVPGYRAAVAYVPELDLSLAVQANALPLASDVHDLLESLVALVADSAE